MSRKRNIPLGGRRLAAALAGIFELRAGLHPAQNVGIDQRVVDHDIAILHGVIAEQRHEARRAGASAHQPDPARLENRESLGIEARKARCAGLAQSSMLILLVRGS